MRKHTVAAAALALGLAATVAAPANASATDTTRLYGSDRYATAVAISKDIFSTANGLTSPFVEQVTVASGTSYPDGLAAGSTANIVGSPLLLVPATGTVPKVVLDEIKRLGASEVAIAGGTGAVSDGVKAQLEAVVGQGKVIRVAGPNRYATAVELSQVSNVPSQTVYLASGENFPDALSAASAASVKGGPLLLTAKNFLPSETAGELKRLTPKNVVIAGGTGAVSNAIITAVKAAVPGVTVTRMYGANRYSTSSEISRQTFASSRIVYFANGATFADALAGGAAGALDGAPLLLTTKDCVPKATLAEVARLKADTFFVLGGDAVLTKNVVNRVACSW